jgi:L-ascorbate metabolism protein UlaG (beta-lactamase superfamily)
MIKRCLCLIGITLLLAMMGCGLKRSLGHNPDGDELAKIKSLPNYKNGGFQNLTLRPAVTVATGRRRRGGALSFLLRSKRETAKPSYGLPWVRTDLKRLVGDAPEVVWFGHSSVLVKNNKATILIDPVFSGDAGPVPFLVSAFRGSKHYHARDMPEIDVVVISHDHYDHLDYRTLKRLKDKVKKFIVPVGIGSHLRYWGFDAEKIVEVNWGDSVILPGVKITATPAQHRSNRTFKEQNKTLWASYVIKMDDYKLFYSGDGGYGDHFKQIGSQYGPFDLALLECGQYSVNWPYTHMMPAQTAQAAVDLRAKVLQPVHWAKFAESNHSWNEPMTLLLPAAKKLGISVSVPLIGDPYVLGSPPKQRVWWDFE